MSNYRRPAYKPKNGFLLDKRADRLTEPSPFLKALEFKQLVLPQNAVAFHPNRKEQPK